MSIMSESWQEEVDKLEAILRKACGALEFVGWMPVEVEKWWKENKDAISRTNGRRTRSSKAITRSGKAQRTDRREKS